MHQLIDVDKVVIPLAGLFQIYGMKKNVQGVHAPSLVHQPPVGRRERGVGAVS